MAPLLRQRGHCAFRDRYRGNGTPEYTAFIPYEGFLYFYFEDESTYPSATVPCTSSMGLSTEILESMSPAALQSCRSMPRVHLD